MTAYPKYIISKTVTLMRDSLKCCKLEMFFYKPLTLPEDLLPRHIGDKSH